MDASQPGALQGAEGTPPAWLVPLARGLGLLAAEGAAVGLGLWAARSGTELHAYVLSNVLDAEFRIFALWNLLGGALAGCLVAGGLLAWKHARGVALVERLGRRLSPLVLAWIVPVVFDWQLWKSHPLHFLALAGLLTIGVQRLTRFALDTEPLVERWPGSERLAARWARLQSSRVMRALPLTLVVLASAGYAAYFGFYTVRNHYRLDTAAMDLGLENNLVWNAIHWGPLFKSSPLAGPELSHGGFHQTYFAYVIGIFYRLRPGPEFLLVFQAIIMGSSAIPLYLLARRRLGAWMSCLIAGMLILYPPLHGAGLYDFHYLPLALPFLWGTLWLVEERRYWWAALTLVTALSIREDVSALLSVIGAYLLLRGERPRAGLIIAIVGATYFVVIKFAIMPLFLSGRHSFIEMFGGLLPVGDHGYGGVLKTVVGNPAFTLSTLLEEDKLVYLLQIAIPLAFFPWRRPLGLLCSVPGFFFTLLSTRYAPLIQTSFQYTTYWTTFLFIAVIANLEWFHQKERTQPERARHWGASRRGWVAALVVGSVVMSYQFGGILQQNTVRGGFRPFEFDLTESDHQRHRDLYELIALVPPEARIVSSETIVPHVSNRPNSYTLRVGMFDAEYLLIRTPVRGDERAFISEAIKGGTFGVIQEKGEFVLAKRGHDTHKNAALVRRYHL